MAMADEDAALPLVNIVGELVALGLLCRDLVPLYQRWANDFATQRTLGDMPVSVSVEQETDGYGYDLQRMRNKDEVRFVIYQRAGWRPVDACRLFDIDERNRTAEFALLIGSWSVVGGATARRRHG
jgi:hypothetical protein